MKMKKKMMGVVVMCLMMACAMVWPAAARGETYDDVTVTALSLPQPTVHTYGYVEVAFQVTNRSPGAAREVTVRVPGNDYGGRLGVSRTVTVQPGSSANVRMWLAPVSYSGRNASVVIDGRRQRDAVSVELPDTGGYYSHRNEGLDVLLSQGVDGRFRDEVNAIIKGMAGSGYGRDDFGVRASVSVAQWSDSWLAYSAFAGVMMTEREWRDAPEPVRQAIMSNVEAGGSLMIVGTFALPERWQGRVGQWQYHGGEVEVAGVGLGRVGRVPANGLLGWDESKYRSVKISMWDHVQDTQSQSYDVTGANSVFSVTDTLGVPVRGMFALMLLFAILIGPVNMVVFSRRNKRMWIFVTIPVLAGVFSLAVFAYAMLSDGVSAVGRVQSLTLLDQREGRALTVGWLGYYAPLRPGDGLRFDEQTELTPQLTESISHSYYRREDRQGYRAVNWTAGQHLTAGWVESRVPAHFTLRKNETRRERLLVTKAEDGSIVVSNGLGSDIHTLRLADENGKIHEAQGPIPAGQKATLRPVNGGMVQSGMTISDSLEKAEDWRATPRDLGSELELVPGSYHATLADAVFTERGLTKMKRFTAEPAVYGLYVISGQGE